MQFNRRDIQQKLHTIEDYEMAVPIVVSMILRDRVELIVGVLSQYVTQIFTMR